MTTYALHDALYKIERLEARVVELEAQVLELVKLCELKNARVAELTAALDAFSKALSMPDGPSLAVQRHDPSWEAWKKLCEQAALKDGA
jgi:Tfp pilus assembly protein FimV